MGFNDAMVVGRRPTTAKKANPLLAFPFLLFPFQIVTSLSY